MADDTSQISKGGIAMAVLNTHYVFHDDDKKELSAEEQDICRYIARNSHDDYDHLIAKDNRWKVFYQLTRMRKSLLNWYDFRPDATLLEIGGGFGAITGLYCDKCSKVVSVERFKHRAEQIYERHKTRENLTVYAGRIEDIPFDEKFDYITVVGAMEYKGNGSQEQKVYSEYLKDLKGLLKPNGRILLAVENRYGLKYFCGTGDPHTGIPFAGINKYPHGSIGYSFSRQELIRIIQQAGLPHYKFYYPLPDYKLPQMIYSQDYIPQTSIRERVIPYYLNQSTLVASELELYDDIIDNQVFEFFSNSFLVECADRPEFCDVIYAAVSTDRGHEEAFATTIHSNQTVRKTALYPEGEVQLRNIDRNLKALKAREIKVTASDIIGHSLCMPYVKHDTLSDHLKKIIAQDPQQFIALLDQLYASILQSSKHSLQVNIDIAGYNEELDYGVILEKAYIDMVPVNCFYYDNELEFFDQEFVKEHYPAKYVLFRALKYTYFFIGEADKHVPLNDLKIKYGLTELWELFEQEEYAFVAHNRKYDQYQSFLARAYIDKENMHHNAKLLLR
ncbi:SAM-dependent methyltransferase [Paenibacillus typhae]|uniref:SAM-dependent methyltransferase n=1 Tax=Paenibacillus typhae TaxID=1174501 RepID=UPI001C8E87ED|nr:methyltransferase domain-containing protein [Paenibacillus typhae]MBY0011670.1 methyltransferase domain-containing protein [Paenibacillus typhae]